MKERSKAIYRKKNLKKQVYVALSSDTTSSQLPLGLVAPVAAMWQLVVHPIKGGL